MATADGFFRYLPVSERDLRWGLYLTGTGYAVVPPEGRYPPHVHPRLYDFTWEKGRVLPEYQVIYITRGEGVFESAATGEKKVAAGTAMLLFPGVWHRYRPSRETGWHEHWLSVNGEYLDRLVGRGIMSPKTPLLNAGLGDVPLAPYLRLLDRVRDARTTNSQLFAAGSMEILAAALSTHPIGAPDPTPHDGLGIHTVEDSMVAEAVRLIWDTAHRPLKVTDVVSAFPITRRSLERRFRAALGHTILEEITRCRMERAKRLLERTTLPLKQVALTAGFSGAERMTKAFHDVEGLAPGTYRQQHLV
jgi:AraC-like DNA-binding protein